MITQILIGSAVLLCISGTPLPEEHQTLISAPKDEYSGANIEVAQLSSHSQTSIHDSDDIYQEHPSAVHLSQPNSPSPHHSFPKKISSDHIPQLHAPEHSLQEHSSLQHLTSNDISGHHNILTDSTVNSHLVGVFHADTGAELHSSHQSHQIHSDPIVSETIHIDQGNIGHQQPHQLPHQQQHFIPHNQGVHQPSFSHGHSDYQKNIITVPAKYDFKWEVKDDYNRNNYGHQESRDGHNTQGSYYVALPDGRLQNVNYYVNGKSGFVADVTYEGQPSYPTQLHHSQSQVHHGQSQVHHGQAQVHHNQEHLHQSSAQIHHIQEQPSYQQNL